MRNLIVPLVGLIALALFSSLKLACADATPTNTNHQAKVTMPSPSSALDAKAESQMPERTNGPVALQSTRPQPAQPTFVDGMRLMFIAARRNPDVQDVNVCAQIAVAMWQQEQAQKGSKQ